MWRPLGGNTLCEIPQSLSCTRLWLLVCACLVVDQGGNGHLLSLVNRQVHAMVKAAVNDALIHAVHVTCKHSSIN